MSYLGDFDLAKVVRFMWATNAIAGESITRATNGTISVYKDGNTTQSTTGVTDSEDYDTPLTGVHYCAIDTSADGTFYSAGSDFIVVLSAATIDGKVINAPLAQFSLRNRSALMPTTAARTLDVSAGGEAGVDWANVGSPTTTNDLSGTNIKTNQVIASVSGAVGSVTGAVGSVTGNVGGNVTGSVGSVVATVAANLTQILGTALTESAGLIAAGFKQFFNIASPTSTMNTITTVTTTTTATNVTNVNGLANNVITTASINDGAFTAAKFAADFLTAAKVATDVGTEIATAVWAATTRLLTAGTNIVLAKGTGVTGFNDLSAAEVNAEADTALSDYGALKPTTAGRTLDVTLTGAAGIDWGNVENAATANDLSGTNIKTNQVIASVSGAVGSVTGNVGGNVTGSIGSLATQAKADVNAEADTALADVGVTSTVTSRIDVATSTRLASASYTAPDNTSIAAILADTGTDGVIVATNNDKTGYALASLSTTILNQIADRTIRRTFANAAASADGDAKSGRSLLGAVARLTNKGARVGSTLTVYEDDDTTPLYTQTLTTDAAAQPVITADTA